MDLDPDFAGGRLDALERAFRHLVLALVEAEHPAPREAANALRAERDHVRAKGDDGARQAAALGLFNLAGLDHL